MVSMKTELDGHVLRFHFSEVGISGGVPDWSMMIWAWLVVWGNLETSILNRSGDLCLDSSETHNKHNTPPHLPALSGGVQTEVVTSST
jgi:hypothetical protein